MIESEDRGRFRGKIADLQPEIATASQKAREEEERLREVAVWEAGAALRQLALSPTSPVPMVQQGPQPSYYPIAPPPLRIAFQARGRPRGRQGSGDGSAVCSADPGKLREFVRQSKAMDLALHSDFSRLRDSVTKFQQSCGWAPLEAAGALAAFERYLTENEETAAWVSRVATAFQNAGGGELTTRVLDLATATAMPTPASLLELTDEELLALAAAGFPGVTVDVVENWWAGLREADREALTTAAAVLIGNLAGIPIATRTATNALRAAELAEVKGISKAERTYWLEVASGERSLVLCLPEFERMIEMFGTIGPNTTHAITYLPGTGITMGDLFKEGPQQVPKYLADHSDGKGVTFVYMDRPWITWTGERRNTNPWYLAKVGAALGGFQRDVIGRDPVLANATTVVGGHSAGFTPVTWPTVQADIVFSLAGSYSFGAKFERPPSMTKYLSYGYDNDPIAYIGKVPGLDSPTSPDSTYDKNVYSGEGMSGIDAHNLTATDAEQNLPLLDDLVQELFPTEEG
ncbi:hypothetical protein [Leucobacter komagatae]|nr:hypothetical protein [Leucobacter komagatae]